MSKRLLLFAVVGLVFFSSCKKDLYPKKDVALAKRLVPANVDFNYLSSKSKIKFKSPEKNFSSAVQIRIRKDSAIWMSVVPALGLEAARVLMTKDTVMIINRLNKEFYAYGYQELSRQYQIPMSFKTFESLFTGNIDTISKDQKVRKKNSFFQLQSTEGNLIIIDMISRANQKISQKTIRDTAEDRELTIEYKRFEKISNDLFPKETLLTLIENGNTDAITTIEVENQKIEIDKRKLSFPFRVSSKYERK